MLRIISVKIRTWKERRREKKILALRSELDWIRGTLEQIQIEGESLRDLKAVHGYSRNREEWMDGNLALRIHYSERKVSLERQLSKMGAAV
jgi:hypothetical protein